MPIRVTLTLIDAWSRTTTRSAECTETVLANVLAAAAALQTDWAALTLLGQVGRTVTDEAPLAIAAAAGCNRNETASLRCRLDNGKVHVFSIPDPVAAVIDADGTLDIADAIITDFVANFMLAGLFRVSEGNYVTNILSGKMD